MKYTIEFGGKLHSVRIGRIPEKAGKYIIDNFDNDMHKYLDAVKAGDVPKELLIYPEWDEEIKKNTLDLDWDLNNLDDICNEHNLLIDGMQISVKNENGDVIFSTHRNIEDESDLDELGIHFKFETNTIMLRENDMLLLHEYPLDGGFHAEIETDDEFDLDKLFLVVADSAYNPSDSACNQSKSTFHDSIVDAIEQKARMDDGSFYERIFCAYLQDKIYYDNNEIELEPEMTIQFEDDFYYSFRVSHNEYDE